MTSSLKCFEEIKQKGEDKPFKVITSVGQINTTWQGCVTSAAVNYTDINSKNILGHRAEMQPRVGTSGCLGHTS